VNGCEELQALGLVETPPEKIEALLIERLPVVVKPKHW
jgi:hypothetical protein